MAKYYTVPGPGSRVFYGFCGPPRFYAGRQPPSYTKRLKPVSGLTTESFDHNANNQSSCSTVGVASPRAGSSSSHDNYILSECLVAASRRDPVSRLEAAPTDGDAAPAAIVNDIHFTRMQKEQRITWLRVGVVAPFSMRRPTMRLVDARQLGLACAG